MAITTLDGIIAGAQQPRFFSKTMVAAAVVGRPASLWAGPGIPGAGSYDTTLNGVTPVSYTHLTLPTNREV